MSDTIFKPGKYQFVSGDSGRRYTLTILDSAGDENFFRCSCRGFAFHGHCKHVEEAILFSEIPDGQLNNDNNTNKKESTMSKKSTATAAPVKNRKVVVVKRQKTQEEPTPARKHAARRRSLGFPLDVPVNVKVTGERAMRKGITLTAHPSDPTLVRVLTGGRGRPSHLAVSDIERVRAL